MSWSPDQPETAEVKQRPADHDLDRNVREENLRLRRTMRDLVALSTMPAIWSGLDRAGIARSLSDVLLNTLSLDLIYVRLAGHAGKDLVEVARSKDHPGIQHDEAVKQALTPLLKERLEATATVRDPFGTDNLQAVTIRFGMGDNQGSLVACSRSANFPSEQDRLLLGVGANQTAIVVQRHQAEKEVHEQREWLRVTLASIGDAVIATDVEGRVTYLNPLAETLTGWAAEDAQGQALKRVFSTINEDTGRPIENPVEKVLRDGARVGMADPTLLIAKDGTERPIGNSAAPILDSSKQIIGVVMIFRDVTMQRRADQQHNARLAVTHVLNQAASVEDGASGLLQAVCENLGWDLGFFWTAKDGGDRLLCQTCWHRPGLSPVPFKTASCKGSFASGEGLPGRVWASSKPVWIADVNQDKNFPRLAAAIQDGLHSAFACPVVIGEQTLGVIEFFARHIQQPDSDFAEMMGTVAVNFGQFIERKAAENELRQSEQELAEFFENATIGLHWVGPDGSILKANRAELDMLGYKREEYIGRHIAEFHADQDVIADILNKLKAGEKLIDYSAQLRCKDGTTKDVLIDSSVRWHEDEFIHTQCFTRDVTESKRAAAALAEADRRKDEFLATLAHELRNPLAPIRNSLGVLKMPGVDAATARQTKEMMERQVHHLVRLVDDLLDVSRVMRGKIVLRKQTVELATVVARAVETVQSRIEAQGHQLELSIPPESMLLHADPIRLTQVLGNLLTNAAKYTEANGHIWLTAQYDGSQVLLKVRDDGIGIAPDTLPSVFELFMQADHAATRSQGGLGVGLTLVKNLVEMHNGTVAAHSTGLGQGSEFEIRLPLMTAVRCDANEEIGEQAYPKTVSRHRLMIVDDNEDAAVSLAMLLRMQGHDVQVAHDGPSALALAKSYLPKLIFLDIGMPGMDGYEVARQMRQQPGLETVVLAALTGWGQQEDRRRTAVAGFDHHLVKPPDLNVLEGLVDGLEPRGGAE